MSAGLQRSSTRVRIDLHSCKDVYTLPGTMCQEYHKIGFDARSVVGVITNGVCLFRNDRLCPELRLRQTTDGNVALLDCGRTRAAAREPVNVDASSPLRT